VATQASAEQMGVALREVRDKAGKSQEDAAKALGVTRVAISNYERGMLPSDFTAEKLPKLAALYNVSSNHITNKAIDRAAHVLAWQIPDGEPLGDHINKFPVAVQVWFHAFMSELLKLGFREDISAGIVTRAREQITFGQLDLWAGGDLIATDSERVLRALRWCAEAAWRSVTEPGWLGRPSNQWAPLPSVFDDNTETIASRKPIAPLQPERASGSSHRRRQH
jgi:transcriptional regulator with XRE-family HTH domain